MRPGRRRAAEDVSLLRIMVGATLSLVLFAVCSVALQALLLPTYPAAGNGDGTGTSDGSIASVIFGSSSVGGSGNFGAPPVAFDGSGGGRSGTNDGSNRLVEAAMAVEETDAASPAIAAPMAATSPGVSDQDAFLELVKRRLQLKTPLDTTFWRPYARPAADAHVEERNKTNLIFVAGAEGTGHHFVTALMMRLYELMPMTLVQEQMYTPPSKLLLLPSHNHRTRVQVSGTLVEANCSGSRGAMGSTRGVLRVDTNRSLTQ